MMMMSYTVIRYAGSSNVNFADILSSYVRNTVTHIYPNEGIRRPVRCMHSIHIGHRNRNKKKEDE
jgi:hypothetical protein